MGDAKGEGPVRFHVECEGGSWEGTRDWCSGLPSGQEYELGAIFIALWWCFRSRGGKDPKASVTEKRTAQETLSKSIPRGVGGRL